MKRFFFRSNSPLDFSNPVPISPEERIWLLTIFNSRLRFAVIVFGILIIWWANTSGLLNIGFSRLGYLTNAMGIVNDTPVVDLDPEHIFSFFFLAIPITAFAANIFFRRILAFRRDAKDGYKYATYLTVVNKLYFPLTDQYFLSLDNPDYLNHEVESDTYNSVVEGDQYPVYFGRYSRAAFTLRGNYQII